MTTNNRFISYNLINNNLLIGQIKSKLYTNKAKLEVFRSKKKSPY